MILVVLASRSFSLPQLEYDGGDHKVSKYQNVGLVLFRFVLESFVSRSSALPQLEYDEKDHKISTCQNVGLVLFHFVLEPSCRTKGPFENYFL